MRDKLISTKEIYGNTLSEIGKRNKDLYVLESDLMKASGTKVFMENFPERHINVGVAEQNLVGVATGLALLGKIPFACTMANFISQRACDQVFLGVSYNKTNVKLVGCYAGLTQEKNGGTHISIMDYAIMRCFPFMKVIAPADLRELKEAIIEVSKDTGPAYIHMCRTLPEKIFNDEYHFRIGKAVMIADGKDLTIISTGLTTSIALESLLQLKKEGIEGRVLHLATLKPADTDLILECAKETRAIITIENHSIFGGLGSIVSEIVCESEPTIVKKIGINDTFGLTADLDFQLNHFGISVDNIIKKAKEILRGARDESIEARV